MITVVLFYCQNRTGHFGQGSFVDSILPSLEEDNNNYRIILVKTDVRNITFVNYIETDKKSIIEIPVFPGINQLTGENTIIQSNYAKYIISVIYQYLFKIDKLIFWANSIDYYNLFIELNQVFPTSKLLYVHHSFSWKYFLNITDDFFCKIWKDKTIRSYSLAYEMTLCQKQMVELCDVTVTVTDHARNLFINVLDIHPTKIVTIYNGIKIINAKKVGKLILRKHYGFRSSDKIIIFSGRITKDKGFIELLEAFRILADKDDNIKLLIAGSGFFSDWISILSPYWNRVIFTGNIDKIDLYNLYQISDVGVIPSYHEQCSFTAIEMSLYRLPMIVSDVDGLKELFTDQYDVLKVPIQIINNEKKIDSKTISVLINQVFNSKELKKRLTKNAYKNVNFKFNIDKINKEYKILFNSLYSLSE